MSIVRSVFEVIPGDRRVGRRAHASHAGRSRSIGAFGGDPFAAAVQMASRRHWLHVVDMDLAFEGEARNLEVVVGDRLAPKYGPSGRRCPNPRRGRRAARRRGRTASSSGPPVCTDASSASALLQREGERLIVGIEVGGDGEDPIEGPRPRPPAADGDARLGRRRPGSHVPCHIRGQGRVRRSVPTSEPSDGWYAPVARCSPREGSHSVDDLRALRAAGASGAVVGTSRPRGHPGPGGSSPALG